MFSIMTERGASLRGVQALLPAGIRSVEMHDELAHPRGPRVRRPARAPHAGSWTPPIALAAKGGFEQVQMRAVAERADVALGTLYRYFPSKIHLLVSVLAEQFEQAARRPRAAGRSRATPPPTG